MGIDDSGGNKTQIIVPVSGGASSLYIACRMQETCQKPICPFSDTKREDVDTYRFLHEVVGKWGLDLRDASDGRDLWDVWRQQHIIPARQIAQCSITMKILPAAKFLKALPADREYRVAYGYDVNEEDRSEKMLALWNFPEHIKPFFPLQEQGITKAECIGYFLQAGVLPPRVYAWRQHANCRECKNFRLQDWEAHAYYDPEGFKQARAFEDEAQGWETPGRWMQDGPLLSEIKIPDAAPSRKGRHKLAMAAPSFSFHDDCGACAMD